MDLWFKVFVHLFTYFLSSSGAITQSLSIVFVMRLFLFAYQQGSGVTVISLASVCPYVHLSINESLCAQ